MKPKDQASQNLSLWAKIMFKIKNDIKSQVILIMLVVFGFMSTFEVLKMVIYPTIETWPSHVVTIIFTTILATITAYFVLKEREKIENSLKESETRFRSLYENSMDAIILSTPKGDILAANLAAEEMFLMSEEEIIKAGRDGLLVMDERAKLAIKERAENGRAKSELIYKRGDGSTFPAETVSSIFADADGSLKTSLVIRDLTERKQMEDELIKSRVNLEIQVKERTRELQEAYKSLSESEEKFREIFNRANDMITLVELGENGQPGRFLEVNDIATERLGFSKDEFLKMDTAKIIDPKYRFQMAENAKKLIKNKHVTFEIVHVTKWGSKIPVEVSVHIFKLRGKDVTLAISRDITERKKAENKLRESEGRLKIAMDMAKLAYWEYDVESDLFTFDNRFYTIYGETAEYKGGPKMSSEEYAQRFLPPEESHWVAEEIEEALKTDNPNFFRQIGHTIIRTDGERRFIIVRFGVIKDNKGHTIKTYGANQDITELKKAEEERKKFIEELKRSNDELERFAYVTSHDLQEPLRTIASFTQLLERRFKGQLDSDADEFIDYIVDASVRMKKMIQDLLEYSRVATKGGEFKPVNSEDVVNNVLSSLRAIITENNAEITYDSLPEVFADENQLTRVFQNLITNAIKFRKEDEPPKIHISVLKDEKENEYVFSVADNGIGIEEQYFDRIFNIFQRLHTRDEYQGTGIGLSVVKRIVERHNGRMWVESELGEGSTFYFTIPIRS